MKRARGLKLDVGGTGNYRVLIQSSGKYVLVSVENARSFADPMNTRARNARWEWWVRLAIRRALREAKTMYYQDERARKLARKIAGKDEYE